MLYFKKYFKIDLEAINPHIPQISVLTTYKAVIHYNFDLKDLNSSLVSLKVICNYQVLYLAFHVVYINIVKNCNTCKITLWEYVLRPNIGLNSTWIEELYIDRAQSFAFSVVYCLQTVFLWT